MRQHQPACALPLRVSVIVPALNETDCLPSALAPMVAVAYECIVADGSSTDATAAVAARCGARVVHAPRGRALQMNAAAASATGDVLLFLHADTRLPANGVDDVRTAVARGALWGRFDVRLEPSRPMLRVVGAMMNLRSRLTGICTGDQAIFVTRELWVRSGGFAPIPLMEDIELTTRLRRVARPAALAGPAVTSSRRWLAGGTVRTIALMWWCRAAYWAGVSPQRLHTWYSGGRKRQRPWVAR